MKDFIGRAVLVQTDQSKLPGNAYLARVSSVDEKNILFNPAYQLTTISGERGSLNLIAFGRSLAVPGGPLDGDTYKYFNLEPEKNKRGIVIKRDCIARLEALD